MLLPLLTDQLSGQLDDHSTKPDHEASSQLLSNILEVLDRTDVVSPVTSYGLNLCWFLCARQETVVFLISGSVGTLRLIEQAVPFLERTKHGIPHVRLRPISK